MKDMTDLSKWDDVKLPDALCQKAQQFPESSMNANRVTITLKDGRRIFNVILAEGAWIAKIGDKMVKSGCDLDFTPEDVADIKSEV